MPRLALLLAIICLGSPAWAAGAENVPIVGVGKWSDKYDNYFRKYTKRYFGPYFDWRWFKSQAVAESNLKSKAKSPRGAIGVMQILPSTFAEIKQRNPHFVSVDEPRWNIGAGIYYDRLLYRKWELPSEQDRLYLAFASYNAGYGRMRRAYKRAGKPVESWEQVKPKAPRETQAYVKRIRGLMDSDTPKPRSRLRGIAKVLAEQGAS
jgi:membrane-bound lytic murein transglycosylase F